MAVRLNGAVFDSQQTLGIFGGHAEECGQPHPEQCAGAAQADSGGYAYNITSADGGGKCGT